MFTTHLHLALTVRMNGAVPLLPPICMAWAGTAVPFYMKVWSEESGLLRCYAESTGKFFTDISKDCIVCLRVQVVQCREDDDPTILRNVGSYLPFNATSYPRRLESSTTPI